jgi:hypothetical protein
MEGSFVFNRASGKDLTSDIVEKLEKSTNRGKHRLLDHRDLTPFYKTISKDGECSATASVSYPAFIEEPPQ